MALITGTPPKINQIDISKGYFDTKKYRYYIQPNQLTTIRYREFLKYQVMLAFNMTVAEVYEAFEKINRRCTGNTPEENLLKINNMNANDSYEMLGKLKNLDNYTIQEDYLLKMCALFCNRPDEDIGVFDEKLMLEKIQDWHDAKININGFFLLGTIAMSPLQEQLKSIQALGKQGGNRVRMEEEK